MTDQSNSNNKAHPDKPMGLLCDSVTYRSMSQRLLRGAETNQRQVITKV